MEWNNLTSRLGSLMAHLPSTDPLSTIDLAPREVKFPIYFRPTPSYLPWISDKYLSLLAPIVVYWAFSLLYYTIDELQIPFFEKYRIHEPEEITKRNRVSKSKVVRMVLLQQFIQTLLGLLVLDGDEVAYKQVFADHQGQMRQIGVYLARVVVQLVGMKRGIRVLDTIGVPVTEWLYWWGIPTAQLWFAFFIMDAWQYFWHRAFHESRFLYRNFHSHHHRLYVPYAFGALYNHPVEGLVLDSLGAAVSHLASFMTVRQGIVLFAFSTMKTVDDHGGYAFPWWIDPLHLIFPNTAEYHDVHHQMQGLRYNYSQPFFVCWDELLGTRMSAAKFKKMRQINALKKEPAEAKVLDESSAKSSAISKDASPKDIVMSEKDPFVTTDAASYRRKAGTST